MHWVLQENLRIDSGLRVLRESLPRWGIPFSVHKVVPFVGEIIPDINPEGHVIVIGAYSMRHVAKAKGWVPGCFDVGHLTHNDYLEHWGAQLLNASGIVCAFKDAAHEVETRFLTKFFSRPVIDSKTYSGQTFLAADFLEWHKKVMETNQTDPDKTTLTPDTEILLAPIKYIAQEYRCWVVDRKVVTASLYKRAEEVIYDVNVDDRFLEYAQSIADHPWQPNRAYVLDIGLDVQGQCRVIEVNTLNSAGFYAADMQKLVEAIERMEF